MTFFNNSGYRGYILGIIIKPSLIYNIDDFEDNYVYKIRSNITNVDVIKILNEMFVPIKGNDSSYPYTCDKYSGFLFNKLKNEGNVIYNNSIYTSSTFINKYEFNLFNKNDIVLLESTIEYHEQLKGIK